MIKEQTPHLEVASFFVTENIQPCSAVGTGTPWASGQQVHEPRRSCELPVRKKRNQICQLLTSGSLPTLSMFQSSWGTSAANVCVPWPGDIARMPDAEAWFEIASGWVKKKKCKSVALAATRYAWRVSFLFKRGVRGRQPPALFLSKYALRWCFS